MQGWQPPTYAYDSKFSVITLAPKMKATVEVKGEEQTIDYYYRCVQVEVAYRV